MMDRRKRLEFALSVLPYDPRTVQLSPAQMKVEDIIARLRTDDSMLCDSKAGAGPTEHKITNQRSSYELSTLGMNQKVSILSQTAVHMGQTRRKLQKQLQSAEAGEYAGLPDAERIPLVENTIQDLNAARLKMLQRWERSKRKALDLLTVEIEKVQLKHDTLEEHTGQFFAFCDGAEEHNTSTPKTPCSDDEDYEEPDTGGKRKRLSMPATSTPKPSCQGMNFEFDTDPSSPMVAIGPNGTEVSRATLQAINWELSGPSITRKLLCEIFDRQTLAYHSLSGKPSPAFKDCARPTKQQLDPQKVADLVYLMTNRLEMTPREVRTAITTKCADENKMMRTRAQRNLNKQS